jgi:hypothetical protein
MKMSKKGKNRCTRSIRSVADMDTLALSAIGGRFATIWYKSETSYMDSKLIGGRKNPLHGRLCAYTCCSRLQIACDYTNLMRIRTQNPDFVAEPLRWGHWMENGYKRVVEHKGKHYLRLYPSQQTQRRVCYILDGEYVTDEYLIKYIKAQLREPYTDCKVYSYENILRLSVDGTTYHVLL